MEGMNMGVYDEIIKLKKENKVFKESLREKCEEYDELKERYKSICAAYCFTMGTDWD
jgi:hypothetical protein